MAGLKDMEELLGLVSKPDIKNYLREAFVCYGAGAYRACIVLTANALFEDLRQKTKAVATINSDAKVISDDIEKLASDQKVFETTLVERLASKGILSKALSDRLKQITSHRNKAAHPSGVHASAEEARWVFFEAIDKFLSQPVLNANQMVDHLVSKLVDKYYFPDISMTNITDITREEVEHLHPLAFDYLIIKVVGILNVADTDSQRNARFFLSGCARLKNSDLRDSLIRQLVKPKASDKAFGGPLMNVVSADPQLFVLSDANTKLRIAAMFAESVGDKVNPTSLRHPLTLLGNLRAELDDDLILSALGRFVDETIAKHYANAGIGRILKKPGLIRDKLVEGLLERAGSGNFDTANSFAKAASDLDEVLARSLDDKEVLQTIVAIARAAEVGANSSKNLLKNKFEALPEMKAKALKYVASKPRTSATVLKDAGLTLTVKEFIDGPLSENGDH